MSNREAQSGLAFEGVIEDICGLNWVNLAEDDLVSVAWVYYYFSVQFRECLEIARKLYPDDKRLLELDHGARYRQPFSVARRCCNGRADELR